MQPIPTPTRVEFIRETDYKGDFLIEPLYPGYGTTVGNSLRRVLLSSIPGAAIVSVKINGVDHEFSTLAYVKEDIVDILLNLKQVHIKIEGEAGTPEEPLKIILKKTGEGKITAGDFNCPTQVAIANKNLQIATLTDKAASFEAECIVEKGLGYVPTENRVAGSLDIGHIAIDAIYTPISYVNAKTENVRVGEMTNWDKLVLTLETNGAITCEEAFGLAVDILKEQFDSLSLNKEVEVKAKAETVIKTDGKEVSAEESSGDEEIDELSSDETKIKKKRGRPKKDSQ